MDKTEIENIKKAGSIASKVKEYAKTIVKKDVKLIEIAEKLESKIVELGGKPAFPVNLSINEIAAHYTPSFNDETKAHGLLKVDFGVQVEGFVADNAYSIDLDNSPENKKLIEAAELGLNNALKMIKVNTTLGEIGKTIETAIKEKGCIPINNLSGHSIEQYNLHAGITIPNYDTKQDFPIEEGLYAIEPFTTNGSGSVRDGKPSGIYHIENDAPVRDSFAREVLQYLKETYETLPFCSRWVHKKFGSRGLLALRLIEQAGILHHYSQLVEKGSGKVAQAEQSVLITKKETIVTTL